MFVVERKNKKKILIDTGAFQLELKAFLYDCQNTCRLDNFI